MRLLQSLTLYVGVAIGAISAVPAIADVGALIAKAEGDLAGIRFEADPQPVTNTEFLDANGKPTSIADYEGKFVLLNFWALWCAPCREEMPALEALNASEIAPNFEVVTVATGRNARAGVDAFFAENSIETLPKLFDPKMLLARDFGALGLPVTILIDPQGREIGRAHGAIHWDSAAAKDLFRTWIAGS
ncbi:MAG: TlpA disulfide reductase family protein [Litoreibacter sp.]